MLQVHGDVLTHILYCFIHSTGENSENVRLLSTVHAFTVQKSFVFVLRTCVVAQEKLYSAKYCSFLLCLCFLRQFITLTLGSFLKARVSMFCSIFSQPVQYTSDGTKGFLYPGRQYNLYALKSDFLGGRWVYPREGHAASSPGVTDMLVAQGSLTC
jgi:hypothetical protein